ncbi:hypothetical protein V2J09_001875, partial [Rumex salicifolius]
ADKVCDTIGFDGKFRAEATGFRGVSISEVEVHHQAVTFEVKRAGEDAWWMSAIYASPTPQTREALWSRLLMLQSSNMKPCLLMGDFNETMNMKERFGLLGSGLYVGKGQLVVNHWDRNSELLSALANLAFHLEAWNRDVFGNLFRRRDRLCR